MAAVGLSVFDPPRGVSGQRVLFELALNHGYWLTFATAPRRVLNKQREGSLPAADLCMSREGQGA